MNDTDESTDEDSDEDTDAVYLLQLLSHTYTHTSSAHR